MKYQIGIIGAGPIGILVAKLLVNRGLKPIIIEAGGWEQESFLTIKNYEFKSSNKVPENVRLIGGQSTKWLGRVSIFPRDSYENKSKIVGHEWIIPYSQIESTFREISELLNIKNSHENSNSSIHNCGICASFISKNSFDFMHDPNVFKKILIEMLAKNEVELFKSTLCSKLVYSEKEVTAELSKMVDGEKINSSFSFNEIYICAGGLDSTRLILNSFPQLERTTAAGKFLMDHFDGYIGTLRIKRANYKCLKYLVLENDRRLKNENFGIGISGFNSEIKYHLELCPRIRVYFFDRHIKKFSKIPNWLYFILFNLERIFLFVPSRVSQYYDRLRNFQVFSIWLRGEEFPYLNSTLSIKGSRVEAHIPNLIYDHRVSLKTKLKLKHSIRRFKKTLKDNNFGKIRLFWWLYIPTFLNLGGNNHPMGTLSMGLGDYFPVDSELRLKVAPRIKIISSAVFPSGSNQNPTSQVMTLAKIATDSSPNYRNQI